MKKCLICGHVDGGDAATCPKCGEASWKSLETSDPLDGLESRKALPVEAPKPKRGRK
jgi:hypothetical protein